MTRLGRPRSPGFTAAQADTFRRVFRNQCAFVGASNKDIGQAIDEFELAGDTDGLTVLQNALAPARKLTHRVARIVVAGLCLADCKPQTLERIEKQKTALITLGGALYAYRAWGTYPAIAAFIPFDSIDDLAARLAAGRPALRKMLNQKLRAEAPAMGLAWCERVRRTPIAGTSTEILEFVGIMERLVHHEFEDAVCAEPSGNLFPSLGREFDVLHRVRPDLTQGFLRELARSHSIDARSSL